MNIRKRLVTWHALILAGLLLIFTMGLYALLRFHLYFEVDSSLASWATHTIESIAAKGPVFDREVRFNSDHLYPHLNIFDSFVLLLNHDEKIATHRTNLDKLSLSKLQRILNSPKLTGSYVTIVLSGQPYRIYFKLVPNNGKEHGQKFTGQKILVLGRSLMHVQGTLSELEITLILAWLVAVIVCSVISWVFVGRTLRPVKSMTQNSLQIAASGELNRRLESLAGNDEFSKLADALNRMLASLETSYATQKKFLADASHELRTPLTSIKANLDFLKRAINAPDDLKVAALQDTISETDRMAGLVNELLMLARAEAMVLFSLKKIDLKEIVTEVILSYLTHRMEVKRTITSDLSGPAMVNGNRDKLRQVVVILLDNARKYSPPGSVIHIKLLRQEDWIEFEISDEGPGIPEDEIEQVFERFYRASNVRNHISGSGLGLSIVKSILDNHHSVIRLRNLQPQGLAVTIVLPAVSGSFLDF